MVDGRGGTPVGVACLRRLNCTGAGGDQRHGSPGDRAHRRRLRSETHRQAGAGRCPDRERRTTECPIREGRESDGLAPWRDLEALVDGRGGSPVGVACLRRLDGARAGGDQRYGSPEDPAHRRRLRIETYRQAGTGGCADRERQATEYQIGECPKGDGLAPLAPRGHLEALVHRCSRGVVGVARLRRPDRARANCDQRHDAARYRAHRRGGRSEAHRKARGGGRADGEWCGAE